MSGQKKLERATRNIRVLAIPSKKVSRDVIDKNGDQVYDKKGKPLSESVQLYKLRPMK